MGWYLAGIEIEFSLFLTTHFIELLPQLMEAYRLKIKFYCAPIDHLTLLKKGFPSPVVVSLVIYA